MEYETTATMSPVWLIIWLVVVVILIAALWKVFTKAGKPGWAVLIPLLQYLCISANCRKAWLVVDSSVHSFCQFYHCHHRYYRAGGKIWQRCGVCAGFDIFGIYLLSHFRLRQCSISGGKSLKHRRFCASQRVSASGRSLLTLQGRSFSIFSFLHSYFGMRHILPLIKNKRPSRVML